jgi:hypothetical protein
VETVLRERVNIISQENKTVYDFSELLSEVDYAEAFEIALCTFHDTTREGLYDLIDGREQAVKAGAYLLTGSKTEVEFSDLFIGYNCCDDKCQCTVHADGRLVVKWIDGDANANSCS